MICVSCGHQFQRWGAGGSLCRLCDDAIMRETQWQGLLFAQAQGWRFIPPCDPSTEQQ